MIVRTAQMAQFQSIKQNQFHQFMISFLRENFSEETVALSDEELIESIELHSSEAEPYAITDQNSIAKFIYLKWLLGDDFEELPDRPWIYGLLDDRSRPAVQRMEIAMAGVEYQFEQYAELSLAA